MQSARFFPSERCQLGAVDPVAPSQSCLVLLATRWEDWSGSILSVFKPAASPENDLLTAEPLSSLSVNIHKLSFGLHVVDLGNQARRSLTF